MTDLQNFVALSLLPPLCWLKVGEHLRAGRTAGATLDRMLSGHWPGQPEHVASLSNRVEVAIHVQGSGIVAGRGECRVSRG